MVYSDFKLELSLWEKGFESICGIDEVGRGCFAGPVVAGAVIFPKNSKLIKGLADSKLLKPKQREDLSLEIQDKASFWAVSEICVECINDQGIGKATQMAFRKAVENLKKIPDFILIDAFFIEGIDKLKQNAIAHGDRICASISAASIVAKVYRDKLMEKMGELYPEYGFEKHKGYGTKFHQQAIFKHGLSKLHRTSFNLSQFLPSKA